MFATRMMRATKMVVGVGIKDIKGSGAAMRKAIHFAQPGDKIAAVHIPAIVPEMMLSSMSDPGDADDDTFAALANLPTKAGTNVQKEIKEVAEKELASCGKSIEVDYKVVEPSVDVKTSLLKVCRSEKAGLLLIGPGVDANGMGKTHECLSDSHMVWLKKQKVFFVGSAPAKGHVNVSPKGYTDGTFAILSPTKVAYLDFTGSGAETIAHSLENRRITLMFVAFEGDPVIMRLFGDSSVIQRDAAPADLLAKFGQEYVSSHGFRAVITVDVHRVQSSCGFSIPFYDYIGERPVLKDQWSKKTLEEVDEYRILKNSFSIDLLPSIGHRVLNPKAPVVAPRLRAGFWFGSKDVTLAERLGGWLQSALGPLSYLTARDVSMLGAGACAAAAVVGYREACRKA